MWIIILLLPYPRGLIGLLYSLVDVSSTSAIVITPTISFLIHFFQIFFSGLCLMVPYCGLTCFPSYFHVLSSSGLSAKLVNIISHFLMVFLISPFSFYLVIHLSHYLANI